MLSPGASATIAIDRPAGLIGDQAVSIEAAPRGGSAAAHIAWAFLKELDRVKKKIGEARNVTNCVIGAIYSDSSTEIDGTSTVHALHSCVDAATGLSGLAKATLRKIAGAILVTDVFYKVADLTADEAFPARIVFDFKGRGATNPDLALGNLDLGTIPSGQVTDWKLTASGGAPPYEFAISTIPANQGRVPGWVSLSSDGTLSVFPPPSVNQYFSFYVFATDASGRRSATGVYLVTFFAHSGTGGVLEHVASMDNQFHFSPNGEFALNFDEYDSGTGEEAASLVDRRTGEVLRTVRAKYPDTLTPSPIADDGTMLRLKDIVEGPLVTVYRLGAAPNDIQLPGGWALGGVELSEDGSTFAAITEESDEDAMRVTLTVFNTLTGAEIRHRTWMIDRETSGPGGQLIPVQLFRLSPDGSSALVEACRSKVREPAEAWSEACDDYGINASDRVLARLDLGSMTYSSEPVTTVTESPADWLPPTAISADGSTIELWQSAVPDENLIFRTGAGALFPVPVDKAWCHIGAADFGPDQWSHLYDTLSGNGRYLLCNTGLDLRLVDLDQLTSVVVYSGPAGELDDIEPLYVADDGGEVVLWTRYSGLLGPSGVYRWTP